MERHSVLVDNTSGMLGMSMRGMVLDAVAHDSTARVLLEECIGMRLVAVANQPVANGEDVRRCMVGRNIVKLTFEREAEGLSPDRRHEGGGMAANFTQPLSGHAGGNEVVVMKGPTGSLGCVFEETRLLKLEPGSSAAAQGMDRFIGRYVTHVNGMPCPSLDALRDAAAQDPMKVVLRFADASFTPADPHSHVHTNPHSTSNPLLNEMPGNAGALRSATPTGPPQAAFSHSLPSPRPPAPLPPHIQTPTKRQLSPPRPKPEPAYPAPAPMPQTPPHAQASWGGAPSQSGTAVPCIRSQPASYEVEIHKRPEEPLGVNLIGMMLDSVRPDSPADQARVGRFIGLQLTHVNGEPVQSLTASMRRVQLPVVRLRFSDPGMEPNEVLVEKEKDEPVGTQFHEMVLIAVDAASPAYRCGLSRFIRRRLLAINGRPVKNLLDISAVFRAVDTRRLVFRFDVTVDAPLSGEVLQLLPGTKIRTKGVTHGAVPNGMEGYIRGGKMLKGVNVAIVGFPALDDGDFHVRYENIEVADAGVPPPPQIAAAPTHSSYVSTRGPDPPAPGFYAAPSQVTAAPAQPASHVSTVFGAGSPPPPPPPAALPAWLAPGPDDADHPLNQSTGSSAIRPVPQPAQIPSAPATPNLPGPPPGGRGADPPVPGYQLAPQSQYPVPAPPGGAYTPLQPAQHPSYHNGFL
eukprot:TRINITY_DN4579_c0_g2_i1.p1 TRINITY_DN4579_c0_g2~~TRINITY_DN4579_c0_g2_i1.p1  ORF type:complete len:705 (+),score=199.35 TRINITY_DN4579_c0_g2_i1:56-2116(+)